MRFIVFIGTFLFFSCSTAPLENDRKGLFERFAELEQTPFYSYRRSEAQKKLSEYQESIREWQWPLKKVRINSHFGRRGRGFHEGVDLKAKVGTPVYASQSGTVVYSGSKLSGYGRMIVLRHKNRLYSVYAHNKTHFVRKRQTVKKGQKIALSGRSGRVSGPHLHFEIRTATQALDPVALLPVQTRKSKKSFAKN